VLPTSKDLAGVRMRLTAGSFRELHWHTADEWAIMLYGNARVTCLNPDGTVFIGDVGQGDLWYFPAGFPHSIQGLRSDGCEFILVFDQGSFSEDNTFLLSDWVRRTPPSVLSKNFGLPPSALKNLPTRLGACTFLLQTCRHPWHRTRPLLAGVGPNPHTNTHLNCQLCPPRSKPGAVQFAWLISISSRRPKISLRLWSPLSQVECANCIGIQTHLNGSTTLAVGGA
jgi:quercetin dioxygenase-like cupin family protein